MPETPNPPFNPASDLPTTREQQGQVQAVAVAEFEWDTVGGKMIDAILDRETSAIDTADKLTDRYGVTRSFWHRHLLGVLEDRGELQTGCPVCGNQVLKVSDTRWNDESGASCTACTFSGQLADFRFLSPASETGTPKNRREG